ncbi:hypothetical protein MP228_009510 [Amoeboaphelidium protococcarum]|nr:hypothetical protein MP228_009510 [Amoeboaphelidium protococcarum]
MLASSSIAKSKLKQNAEYSHHGWQFRSQKGTIASDSELLQFEHQFGYKSPLMLFPDNKLQIQAPHAQLVIEWNAMDALKKVQLQKPPYSVKSSQAWRRARNLGSDSNNDVQQNAAEGDYDWTYWSDYMGTFQFHQDSSNSDTVEWNVATLPQHKMNMHKIAHGGEIKYFDSVILYEDELDDNGCSQYSVKIRVMQDYWFALCQMQLFIDGVIRKSLECRYYYEFGSRVICREIKSLQNHTGGEQLQLQSTCETFAKLHSD